MKKRVVFLNTFHYSMDDRVFYHQAKSLNNNGYQVIITSTKEDLISEIDGILISSYNDKLFNQKQKFVKIIDKLGVLAPDIIICDSPIAVLASRIYNRKHQAKIIYDITEWYPSKKNLQSTKGFKQYLKTVLLSIVNIIAGISTDKFIFGEYYKSIPFRCMFFWKKYLLLPYYPNLDYIQSFPSRQNTNEFNFLYSGTINIDKGIDFVIKTVNLVAMKHTEITFILKIIGNFNSTDDREYFIKSCSQLNKNLNIELVDFLAFPEFCKTIGKADIFFDLRKIDIENTHCLPIKLFYYIACGRPVIYSNLKAINKAIPNFNFGCLFNPMNIESIAQYISKCITFPDIYERICTNASQQSTMLYNWGKIEKSFVLFIKNS